MGCPRHKNSNSGDKYTRLDPMKFSSEVEEKIETKVYEDNRLYCTILKEMAEITDALDSWCLEKDDANRIIKRISISSSTTISSNIPAGITYLGQLITHDLLGETSEESNATSKRYPIANDFLSKKKSTQVCLD